MHDRPHPPYSNEAVARALEALAAELDDRGANPHRVQAYLTAAATVRRAPAPLADVLDAEGLDGLTALPGVGARIAARIVGFLHTGELRLLRELREQFDPAAVFTRVPGIGAELAHRLHDELGVTSLEALETAAHDGRLARVEGFGPRRVQAVRDQLGFLLSRSARRRLRQDRRRAAAGAHPTPPVDLLLNLDLVYRRRSAQDELPRIAPSRFNPAGDAWLPVLHTRVDGWAFTVVFSNTARAHELGRVRDWVIVYYEQAGRQGQCTVVTETRGPLRGERVVRGREPECRTYYHGGTGADLPASQAA